jgi:hypothetical protein
MYSVLSVQRLNVLDAIPRDRNFVGPKKSAVILLRNFEFLSAFATSKMYDERILDNL